jgi:hypothetical protein
MARQVERQAFLQSDSREGRYLIIGEDARPRQKPDAAAVLQGEHAALAGHNIDDELGVLPIGELGPADEEGRPADLPSCTSLSPVMKSPAG